MKPSARSCLIPASTTSAGLTSKTSLLGVQLDSSRLARDPLSTRADFYGLMLSQQLYSLELPAVMMAHSDQVDLKAP